VNQLEIISRVFPVLFLILIGYLLAAIKLFDSSSIAVFKKLILNICLPSLLFLSFAHTQFRSQYLIIIVVIFSICLLMLVIGRWVGKILGIKSPYYGLMFGGFEAGMLGYSLFSVVFGEANTWKFAIIDLGQVAFVFFILVTQLLKLKDGLSDLRDTLKSFFKSPVILAILLGVLISSLGITTILENNYFTGSLLKALSMLAAITVPLISVSLGYELIVSVKDLGRSLKLLFPRVLVLLALALLVDKFLFRDLLALDPIFRAALFTMFSLPPPFIIPLLLKENDSDNQQFVLNTLSLYTVVSLLLFLVVITVFLPMSG